MMTQLENLIIRQAAREDLRILQKIAESMKSAKDIGYFELSFEYQDAGERFVFITEHEGRAAGYAMLSWTPKYGFYKVMGYPEIQDLNVLPEFRRKGIATAVITHCEDLARKNGQTHMGISVGLTASYGPAQRLYVKLGYIPDGHGVTYDRQSVTHGEIRPVDDDLCLMMVKDLQS
ncbi:MAG: GNAT family N-acetyltransferase [Alphaproteobacteria bacterium]